jgi:hypothetical protein
MTAATLRTGSDRLRTEAKRPPGGAVGRCRCGRTGWDLAVNRCSGGAAL